MTHTAQPKKAGDDAIPICTVWRGGVSNRVPFWLMRQAGRYLPEYRALRAEAGNFLALCYNPQLAAEVTLQPIRRFDMDAAIIFSDILVVPHGLGRDLRFAEGEGPRLDPVRTADDLERLRLDNITTHLQPLYEALRMTRAQLSPEKALIGFAGAPWTVACYMIDGRGGGFAETRARTASDIDFVAHLVDIITEATITSLLGQIAAGANAVQLFDSWAGLCPPDAFTRLIVQPAQKITAAIKAVYPEVPVIGFPRGAAPQAATYVAATGVDALGLDQGADIDAVAKTLPQHICLQGNLDPETLLAGGPRLRAATLTILEACHGRPFVFNLGHGVIKETPPEHVAALAQIIREYRA